MVLYNLASNHVGSRALFHLTIIPFFVFYAVFAFMMYPMRGILHHPEGEIPILFESVWKGGKAMLRQRTGDDG